MDGAGGVGAWRGAVTWRRAWRASGVAWTRMKRALSVLSGAPPLRTSRTHSLSRSRLPQALLQPKRDFGR
eukprot:COSAG04_NODE_12465_length_651_cov_1.030797_1_plen_69_part_10